MVLHRSASAQDATIEHAEGDKGPVATFTADDPEGATSITWAVAAAPSPLPTGFEAGDFADAEHFDISKDGVLTFDIGGDTDPDPSVAPDYEAPRGVAVPDGTTAAAANTYNVVVSAADGTGADAETGYHKVTVKVTNVDEPGKVTWTVDPDGAATVLNAADVNGGDPITQFQVGAMLTASVDDGDIAGTTKDVESPGATAPIWRWYRSSSKTSEGTLITGAGTNAYTVGLDDVGMYMRVVAHYVVTGNVDQETAPLTSDYPVLAARVGAHELEFDPVDPSRSVAEGDKGADVGAPVTATGNHGAVNYVLTGADNAKFAIDAKTGQITTDADLDYEAGDGAADNCDEANACVVIVTATDASGQATEPAAMVAIKITDVNEKPKFTDTADAMSPETITRAENMTALAESVSAADVTYAATDPEGLNLTYHLTGPDGAKFQLSTDRVLSFKEKPDYEEPADRNKDNVYEVTVRASDGTLNADRMVRVTVTNVPEAPDVMGVDSVDHAENDDGTVATFTAEDPEGATSITWAVAAAPSPLPTGFEAGDFADAEHFDISKDGVLTFDIGGDTDPDPSVAPDYEAPRGVAVPDGTTAAAANTYNVVVSAADGTDANAETGYHKVTVKVTNVDEPGKVTWTVDPDGAATVLNAADVNGGDPITQFQVGAILTASATDGDIAGPTKDVGDSQSVTWRWYRGGSLISGATTESYEVKIPDTRSRIRVEATYRVGDNADQENASLTSVHPVLAERVAAQDHELEFDPAAVSRSVAEGDKGASVGARVTATGNYGVVNYALTGSDDDAKFEIDGKTGRITTGVDLDFEAAERADDNCVNQNSCVVTVTATDASGEASNPVATVTIKITDVDEKPMFATDPDETPAAASPTAITVPENETSLSGELDDGFSAEAAVNVTYAATDEDGLNVNLTLMGADAAKFSLDSAGVLSFRAKPDYENPGDANRDNVYEVTVRANDGTMTADQVVKVTVTNVNEAPEIMVEPATGLSISGSSSPSVAEGTTSVAIYRASGPNSASANWTLGGADAADFSISSTGALKFAATPDYEVPADAGGDNVYMVTVTATDSEGASDSIDVTVTVTDVADTQEPTQPTTLLDRYDADDSGDIDQDEVIEAINDYLFGTGTDAITKDQAIEVINLYLFG